MAVSDILSILDSIGKLIWPILAAVAFWKLYPAINDVIKSRGFTLKIAGMEVSVQQASEQIAKQIQDLQNKVAEISNISKIPPEATVVPGISPQPSRGVKRILWVDDKPSNNAFQVAQLRDKGHDVILALSTADAMSILMKAIPPVDVIITDMGRTEDGQYRATAGITLINEARGAKVDVPIFVYSTPRTVGQHYNDIMRAGGNGATSSPVELIELLKA